MNHSRKMDAGQIALSVILVFLVVFDISEIWVLTSSIEIKEGQFDVLNTKNINQVQQDQSKESQLDLVVDQNKNIDDNADKKWTDKEWLKERQKRLAETPIDEPAMIKKLAINPTVQLFCTNDLKKDQSFTKKTFILVSNYTFLLRVSAVHIIIIALPYMPVFQLSLLIVLELGYLAVSLVKYIQKKHLRSLRLLIPKVWQSLYLLVIELIFLFSFLGLKNRQQSLSKTTQVNLVYYITVGTIAEFIIMLMNIVFLIYQIYLEKKVLKNDPKGSEKLIKSSEFFIYVQNGEGNSSNLPESKRALLEDNHDNKNVNIRNQDYQNIPVQPQNLHNNQDYNDDLQNDNHQQNYIQENEQPDLQMKTKKKKRSLAKFNAVNKLSFSRQPQGMQIGANNMINNQNESVFMGENDNDWGVDKSKSRKEKKNKILDFTSPEDDFKPRNNKSDFK